MVHTSREELERLAELRTVAGRDVSPPAEADACPGPTVTPPVEHLPAQRDRSRLPSVYLDARRRLRERLEGAGT
jgi:hypothetical protein